MLIDITDNKCNIDFEYNTIVCNSSIDSIKIKIDGKDVQITHIANGIFIGAIKNKNPLDLYKFIQDNVNFEEDEDNN